MKRGLPRALMTDNGAAMLAEEETVSGLATLGIVHQTTLPYSPYQNAKQESFWGRVEGR
jgi:putative transposase